MCTLTLQAATLVKEALAACPSLCANPRAAALGGHLALGPRSVFTLPSPTSVGTAAVPPPSLGSLMGAVSGPADALVLVLPLPWPLDLVLGFGPESGLTHSRERGGGWGAGGRREAGLGTGAVDCAKVYADVGSALLRLRLCRAALQRAWLVLGKPAGGARIGARGAVAGGSEQRAQRRLRGVRAFLAAALHWVGALQRHAATCLHGECAQWLGERLGGTGGGLDVRQAAALHARYLRRAAAACFLPPPTYIGAEGAGREGPELPDSLRGAVVRGLLLCEKFAAAASNLAAAATAGGGGGSRGSSTGSAGGDEEGAASRAAAVSKTADEVQRAHTSLHAAVLAAHRQLSVTATLHGGSAASLGLGAGGGDEDREWPRVVATSLLMQLDCPFYQQ